MSYLDLAMLTAIMIVMAAMPSSSVVLVVARSAAFGLKDGVATAMGIVAGDLVFVLLALTGLVAVAGVLGDWFVVLKYLAGAYLIWFGISLWRSPEAKPAPGSKSSPWRSFLAGLAFTLGDLKAVFFYASLFPMFVNADSLQHQEAAAIVLLTLTTVGGVKVFYAYFAQEMARALKGGPWKSVFRRIAGSVLVAAGVTVVSRA